MSRLGYDRYGAQGGDWGTTVTTHLADVDADHLVGIHVNMAIVGSDVIRAAGESPRPPSEPRWTP